MDKPLSEKIILNKVLRWDASGESKTRKQLIERAIQLAFQRKEEEKKQALKRLKEVLDWIKKEVSIQPTDRGIQHIKTQIISYIIPQAEEEIKNKIFGDKLT